MYASSTWLLKLFFFLPTAVSVQQEEDEVGCGQECYLYKMS